METYTIKYKGQTLKTKWHTELSDEKYLELKTKYLEKPSFEEVKKQFETLVNGGSKLDIVTQYYVKDLMCKTKLYSCKWSIEDVLNYKPLVEFFMARTADNKKVFLETATDLRNFQLSIHLGGKGVAKIPAQFLIKTVDTILEKYNINNNWYDFSCGWGARLCGALKHNVNYYGTDPNYLLTKRLKQLTTDWKSVIDNNSEVEIKTQGSEIYNPNWANKMGLAFSSPPFFCLEDYKVGNQSYQFDTTYDSWKQDYLEPTIKNIHTYLIDNGYFVINIGNFDKYNLVKDTIELAEKNGFNFVENFVLNSNNRPNSKGGFNDDNEGIFVFKKK